MFTAKGRNLNPYFPLKVGNRWVYEGGDETITVEVLRATKLIEANPEPGNAYRQEISLGEAEDVAEVLSNT
jgi:hypothetical protein